MFGQGYMVSQCKKISYNPLLIIIILDAQYDLLPSLIEEYFSQSPANGFHNIGKLFSMITIKFSR